MAEVSRLCFPEMDTELEICDEKARQEMKGATADTAGETGQVPAPPAGAQDRKFLRGDGTWQVTPNTTYNAATQSAAGLMSAADKKKLDEVATNANNYSHPTNAGNKHIPSGGSAGQILRWSADGTATWGADNNTTYGNMGGANASASGKAGLVPAPAAGAQGKYLRGDGTWQTPLNTTYGAASQSTAGLMSAADKKKLDGVATNANHYSHPTSAGNKHIPSGGSSGQILRWSADGTAVWGADNNTTYGTASQSANGLMSAADKKKLDGIASGANVTPAGLSSGYVTTGQKSGTTLGRYATAEGKDTTASNTYGHAEGCGTTASGGYSHAEGQSTTASGGWSHAEGIDTIASGTHSHAEGQDCKAQGFNSHAEGYDSVASGESSHAEGYGTIAAGSSQHAQGHFNVGDTSGSAFGTQGTAFIIGNGSTTAKSNAFRVRFDGVTYSKGAYNASGADYAEYFEWKDKNPQKEDRRGYFVTLDGDKIRKADASDPYILGIISAKPVVVGNSDPEWQGAFLKDVFGDYIIKHYRKEVMESVLEDVEETYIDEDGKEVVHMIPRTVEKPVIQEYDFYEVNPNYDPDRPYIPRSDRPEWDAVGMLGVLAVRDDGTCQVNGYCNVSDEGIATASDAGWRVIARVTENIVKVVFR